MNLFSRCLTALICLAMTCPAWSQHDVDGEWGWDTANVQSLARPPMWDVVIESATAPRISLEPADRSAPGKLDKLRSWNLQRRTPVMEGISHEVGEATRVLIDPDIGFIESGPGAKGFHSTWQTANGEWMWSETYRVEKSHRLRLKLENLQLPEGAKLWVIGPADEFVGPFGADLSDSDGNLWTPSVAGRTGR